MAQTNWDIFDEFCQGYIARAKQFNTFNKNASQPSRQILEEAVNLVDQNMVTNDQGQKDNNERVKQGIPSAKHCAQIAPLYEADAIRQKRGTNQFVVNNGLGTILHNAPEPYSKVLLEKITEPKGQYTKIVDAHRKLIGIKGADPGELVNIAYESEYNQKDPAEKTTLDLLRTLTANIPKILKDKRESIVTKVQKEFTDVLAPNKGGYLAENIINEIPIEDGVRDYAGYHAGIMESINPENTAANPQPQRPNPRPNRRTNGRPRPSP
jgi:hypothetical protein